MIESRHFEPPHRGWHRVAVLLVLATAACSPRPLPADPFAGGRSPVREGVRRTQVRLEVGCEGCDVRYWVGPEATNARANRSWSKRLDLTPLMRTAMRLSATPREAGRPIRYLRIIVDGDVVAEGTCSACGDRTAAILSDDRTTVTIETTIPRQ